MGIEVNIISENYIKDKEVAYGIICRIEEISCEHFFSSKILQAHNVFTGKDFYDCFINSGLISEDFFDYIKDEYGNPWVSEYPIDIEVYKEALMYWCNLDEGDFYKCINAAFAKIAIENPNFRYYLNKLFEKIVSLNGGTFTIIINPIPKELRHFSFEKNLGEKKNIRMNDSDYNSVLESLEAIYDLCNDELIKQQVDNIKSKIQLKEEPLKKEASIENWDYYGLD